MLADLFEWGTKILVAFLLYRLLLAYLAGRVASNMLKRVSGDDRQGSRLSNYRSTSPATELHLVKDLMDLPIGEHEVTRMVSYALHVPKFILGIHMTAWTFLLIVSCEMISRESVNGLISDYVVYVPFGLLLAALIINALYFHRRDNALPFWFELFAVMACTVMAIMLAASEAPVRWLSEKRLSVFSLSVAIYILVFIVNKTTLGLIAVPKNESPSLLLLRVFGNYENSSFTFGSVVNRWKYIGGHITIADPEYFRYRYRYSGPQNLTNALHVTVVLILVMLILSLASSLFGPVRSMLSDMGVFREYIGIIIILLIALAYSVQRITKQFITSRLDLDRQLEKSAKQKRNNMQFAGTQLYCFEKMWKVTLEEIIRRSDVILMDLRGFTPENRGCEYEIEYMVDNVQLSKVHVLVDGPETMKMVVSLFEKKIGTALEESPNYNRTPLSIKIFDMCNYKERLMLSATYYSQSVKEKLVKVLLNSAINVQDEGLNNHRWTLRNDVHWSRRISSLLSIGLGSIMIIYLIHVGLAYYLSPEYILEKYGAMYPLQRLTSRVLWIGIPFFGVLALIPVAARRKVMATASVMGYFLTVVMYSTGYLSTNEVFWAYDMYNVSSGAAFVGMFISALIGLVLYQYHTSIAITS